jgi:lipopolysaccharide/colanic/teichoic acid biosynthesis glycosyltransferase
MHQRSSAGVKPHTVSRGILLADLTWSAVAWLGAVVLRYGAYWKVNDRSSTYALLPFLAVTIIAWILLSVWMKLDSFRGGWHFPALFSRLFLALFGLICVLLSGGYLARDYVSRLALSYFVLLLFGGFAGIRYAARFLLLSRYRAGKVRRVVIVGANRIARELALKFKRHPEMTCTVVGFLYPEDAGNLSSKDIVTITTFGVTDLLAGQRISDLILALPGPFSPEILNLVAHCRECDINVSFVPHPYELYLSKPALLDVDGIPVLELSEAFASEFFFRCKRAIDIVLATAMSAIALPILLPTVIGLRWTKGRAFCWETRCGQHGQVFSMLRLNVERHTPKLSGLERQLENLSITELPELWNVLRGEMSLVGPRPESPERVRRYSEWQQRRLSIKPGMTGLAQVQGLRDQSSSEDKARFDLQYILHPSAIADISILLQTLWTLALRLFQYPRVGTPDSNPELPGFFDRHVPSFVEKTLQNAHRSQSSAD